MAPVCSIFLFSRLMMYPARKRERMAKRIKSDKAAPKNNNFFIIAKF
jgi:hypothetical protein